MKRLLVLAVLAVLAWYGWGRYQSYETARHTAAAPAAVAKKKVPVAATPAPEAALSFVTCDGRNACEQMRSCEEAKYFVANCPGMATDAARDGISCVQQWCR